MVATNDSTVVAGRFRLSPRGRKTVMVLHIVTSVALLGEVWALVALNVYATSAADADLARSAYRLMEVLVFAGGIPLSMTALIAGITLASGTHWGLLRHYWIFAKLLLLVAVILCGMVLFQPAPMAEAMANGTLTAAEQWRQVAVVAVQLVMLVSATVLSVFKPKGWMR